MKVLVLGAGGAASNGVVRALRVAGHECVGANCSETELLLSECDANHLIAHADEFEEWQRGLDGILRRHRIDFVHAQNDGEVEALGRSRTIVHLHGAGTCLPRQEVIRMCRDKWVSYQTWNAAGVPVPKTQLVRGRDAIYAMTRARDGAAWVRPRVGAGGQRALRTADHELICCWINRFGGWGEFTIAEALTNATVTVQQLYRKGELVFSQQRSRMSWANGGSSTTGVSGSTGVGVTSSDPAADEVADRAVAAIDDEPHGLYGIDMCRHMDGTPRVTEINIGRFFTTVPEFFATAGFNAADMFVSGEAPDEPVRNPLPDGLRWIRGMDRAPVIDPQLAHIEERSSVLLLS